MPRHAERRFLPYTQEQLFDLVADVESYPQFLPWCIGCRIRSRQDNVLIADLIIGFKMVREQFTSRVALHQPTQIDVEYTHGPLKYLQNRWIFEPAEGGTVIDFYVDFEFRSLLLQRLIGALFTEAVRRMVGAFEARARELYGPSGTASAASPSRTPPP